MLIVKYSNLFKKDLKLMKKRGLNINLLKQIIEKLANNEKLPEQNRDPTFCLIIINGYRECHIQPDWLLIYKIDKKELILTAFRTGSHSDLFD